MIFGATCPLTEMHIRENVSYIGELVFYGCDSLIDLTVDEGNTVFHSAGNCVIETKEKMLVIGCKGSVMPNDGSINSIGYGAFAGHTQIEEIVLPDSIVCIGESAFDGCLALRSVFIPESVEVIGLDAFYDCPNLERVVFEAPEGWRSANGEAIDPEMLSDPETAAEYVVNQYSEYDMIWVKK